MKTPYVLMMSLLLIAGCSQPTNETAEQQQELAATDAATAIQPSGYYEYLWCQNGENWSNEAMTTLVADWNAEIDQLGAKPTAAFGYVPRGWEDDNFDALWVINWPSKEVMAAGWAEYAANDVQTKVDSKNPGVISCGAQTGVDRFPEISYTPKAIPASFDSSQSPYYITNQLCSFNPGKSADDVRNIIRGEFLPAVEAVNVANPESTYWFRIGRPDYTPLTEYRHDFNWVNIWQNAEEGEASNAAFASSDAGKSVQAAFNEVATCVPEVPQAWDGWFIRTGAPRS